MRKSTILLAAGALAAGTVGGLSPASAAGHYDPNVTRIANPANTCKSIEGSVKHAAMVLETDIPFEFDFAGCVSMLAQGDAYVADIDPRTGQPFGSPYAQCAALEQAPAPFAVTYPYVFHASDSPEDVLLPDLLANNRKQCGSALYAFHTIFTAVGPYLEAPE